MNEITRRSIPWDANMSMIIHAIGKFKQKATQVSRHRKMLERQVPLITNILIYCKTSNKPLPWSDFNKWFLIEINSYETQICRACTLGHNYLFYPYLSSIWIDLIEKSCFEFAPRGCSYASFYSMRKLLHQMAWNLAINCQIRIFKFLEKTLF